MPIIPFQERSLRLELHAPNFDILTSVDYFISVLFLKRQ